MDYFKVIMNFPPPSRGGGGVSIEDIIRSLIFLAMTMLAANILYIPVQCLV